MIRVDTNYILRYFLNDNEKMAKTAEEIIRNNEVFVSNEVIDKVLSFDKKLQKCIVSREQI